MVEVRDYVYSSLLAFSLVFGIALCLAKPEFTILYALMVAMAPLASRGYNYYRSLFGRVLPGREKPGDYRWALLGLIPLPVATLFMSGRVSLWG